MMFKAVLINSGLLKRDDVVSFADCCKNAGLKVKEVKSKKYEQEAVALGFEREECIAVDNTIAGIKTIRDNKLFALALCEEEKTNSYILAGADLVLVSLFEIDCKDIDSFNTEFMKLVEDFRQDSIIGVLMEQAVDVRLNAYAKYSAFKVGAAILTDKNTVYCGCNVENASFGGTICAERGAAMTAIAAEGKTKFKAIAIASQMEEPAPPCGLCRQFLSEFSDGDMQVYLYSVVSKVFRHYNFRTILPLTFTDF